MGVIKCEIHGDSDIVQMSDVLYKKYFSNKKLGYDILKIVFDVKELGSKLIYYDLKKNLEDYKLIKSLASFEVILDKISGDKGACTCIKCFNAFLSITI